MRKKEFFKDKKWMEKSELIDDPECYDMLINTIDEWTEHENSLLEKELVNERLSKKSKKYEPILVFFTHKEKEKRDEDYALELIRKFNRKAILKYFDIEMNGDIMGGKKGTIEYIIRHIDDNGFDRLMIKLFPKYRDKIVFII